MRLFRKKNGLFAAIIGGSLALAGGYVLAQQTPPPADTPPPAPEEPEVDQPIKKRATISPGEMVEKAVFYIRDMQRVLKRVVGLQEIARRQKDVIKLNCVNDKLIQVKQLLNIAEGANTNLQESIARKDEEGRYHEFGRITIAFQQVTVLGTEAENCIGQDLSFLGPTQVTVDTPLEPDDPTAPTEPDIPVVEPPPTASPFN